MKITNPFVNAKISVLQNGEIEIKLLCGTSARVPIELNDKMFLMDDLRKLLKAKYLAVYPETGEEKQ